MKLVHSVDIPIEAFTVYPKIVLHIDDDQDDRYLVRQAINNIDSSIILREAQDGRKAIDFLHQAKLFGDLPCLIILDINMPIMNGYDTFKEISKDEVLSAIPVVIFTTSRNSNELNYWKDKNIETVSKPATFEEFTHCIKRILGAFSPTLRK
jgi:CheY-like chemotaxis protein